MWARLVDTMGDDLTVVNAARVSFAKQVDEFNERDGKLIQYLAQHNHWTPFSHVTATFHVCAPIFVARQLFKHKVGLTENEVSRRYVDDDPKFYVPPVWRGRPKNAKQGSDGVVSDDNRVDHAYSDALDMAYAAYDTMIDAGVAPEQARMVLPQSMMTEWYWTGSLSAFSRVVNLRLSKDAQEETGLIAQDINNQLAGVAPVSWAVLTERAYFNG